MSDFSKDPARACGFEGADLWFTSDTHYEQAKAREICRRPCPVRLACVTRALATGERWHVWGGFLMSRPTERNLARRWVRDQERIRARRQAEVAA